MPFKQFKYRIYPTELQKEQLEHHFNCCRLVWNLGLAAKKQAWESNRINLSCYDLHNQLVDLKKDHVWLYKVNAQSLQSVLNNLDRAYKSFYRGRGFPKFKSKYSPQSFQCRGNVRRIDWGKSLLSISHIPNIPIVLSRKFYDEIRVITISKTITGKYYASILVKDSKKAPNKSIITPKTTIGIDLGVKDFLVTSSGIKIDNPKYLRNNLKRLKCLQRRATRKKKGSSNRKKANKKLALKHELIANMRKDFLHKTTSKLARDNQADTFCVENLNVKGMVKNHKLAQAISDVSWGEFIRQMKYKCDWYGKNLIQIGRFEPSSKTCSSCGKINDTLTLADREWACASCGSIHDRDLNAAINIKNIGLKTHSGEGLSGEPVESLRLRKAKKQESLSQSQLTLI